MNERRTGIQRKWGGKRAQQDGFWKALKEITLAYKLLNTVETHLAVLFKSRFVVRGLRTSCFLFQFLPEYGILDLIISY
jgi:hypothetical protein